ncbi:flagellar basal body rod protein FlgC [Occallatibacter savannae]|uniref:flagellar basal body rod protein FlgC n=1 Tax=Occallatibacter savannae TaxID=1002691 RepID=UPI000D69C7F8|nr:flagellar basal body rod protein FlgC [Occallatibacter savannae]
MNLFGIMEASGSAMRAERIRAEVVAANMANAETTRTEAGGPYRRRHLVFAENPAPLEFGDRMQKARSGLLFSDGEPAGGVHIETVLEDKSAPLKRYDPGHPDAGPDGYVAYPDINPLTEMVDLMGASRAYGLNSSAVQAEKSMITSALEIARS